MPLVAVCQRFLVFFYDGSLKIFHLPSADGDSNPVVVKLPSVVGKQPSEKEKADSASDGETKESGDVEIICGSFSGDSNHLATCDNKKRLILWNADQWSVSRVFKVHRRCVKVSFTSDASTVLVADRSGDVYMYRVNSNCDNGQLLLGHLSMLLDMCFSPDEKYLLTSDRDEKIRVSCYPNGYNIHSYCMGHKEFVGSICFLTNSRLVSGSGDGTLRLWNHLTGKELSSYDFRNDVDIKAEHGKCAVKQLLKVDQNRVMATFYGTGKVCFYFLKHESALSLLNCIEITPEPVSTVATVGNYLIILTLSQTRPIVCIDIEKAMNGQTEPLLVEVTSYLCSQDSFVKSCLHAGHKELQELSGLYKTWFDNVEVYLKKKSERQNAKKSKRLATAENHG